MVKRVELTAVEQRVIGCLIEKSITTPDLYPLSLNALTNACNQKSNREPVMSLSEAQVQDTIEQLLEKRLVIKQAGASSRVAKYQHRFCNTEFSDLQLTAQQLGIICVLLLRGPQTPGELRTRTARLCQFSQVSEVEALLTQLTEQSDPIICQLPREPGRRESRYQHCFSDMPVPATKTQSALSDGQSLSVSVNEVQPESAESATTSAVLNARISQLEEQVELLTLMVEELQEKLSSFE
ncbi:YceH family protein [Aliikangiella maris]|uniref:YceH family protein n=2 Tax=Aliikangiella maris TaxID=3162458 RepID=A0ABV2BUL6_9GAMM